MRIARHCLLFSGLLLSGCMLPRPVDPSLYTNNCRVDQTPQFRGLLFYTTRLPDCRKPAFQMSWHRARSAEGWQGLWASDRQQLLEPISWTAELERQIGAAPTGTETILYIHGFNNTHDEALRRAHAIRTAVGDGRSVLAFTWPSYASKRKYFWDEVNAEWTGGQAMVLLERLAFGGRKVIIVAHSMGNRVALDLVRSWPLRHPGRPIPIAQLIMASPDVDRAWFARQAEIGLSVPVTLYGSTYDQPLSASWRSHAYARAGDLSARVTGNDLEVPYSYRNAPAVTVVDTSLVATGLLKHSDFIESAQGAADLCRVITGVDPSKGREFVELPNMHRLRKLLEPSDVDSCATRGWAAANEFRK